MSKDPNDETAQELRRLIEAIPPTIDFILGHGGRDPRWEVVGEALGLLERNFIRRRAKMSPAPTNKQDFYRRWKNLEFGNRVRMWDSQAELLASGYDGTVTARSKVPGGPCMYGVPADKAATSPVYAGMTFNETAPDGLLLVQGELMHDGLKGYALYCSTDKLPMRKALASSGKQHYGLAALGRLKHWANAKGYDMLMELLDLYPEAVVEFGCYSRDLGEMPYCNTIVWEVRNY